MVSALFYCSRESSLPSAPPVCTYPARAAAQSGPDDTPLIHKHPDCFLRGKTIHVYFPGFSNTKSSLNFTNTYMYHFMLWNILAFAQASYLLPAVGSSSNGGSWREDVGDDGVSGGLVVVVLPPPPSLGPDRALLR